MNNIKQLQNKLAEDEAVIILSEVNRLYFTGIKTTNGLLLVLKDKSFFLTDFRYYELAINSIDKNIKVIMANKGLYDAASDILGNEIINVIYFEGERVDYAGAKTMFNELKKYTFVCADKMVDSIRQSKSDEEMDFIRKAQTITDSAFEYIIKYISSNWKNKSGLTEKQIAFELEYYMRKIGSGPMPFDIICASGLNSACPHAVPTDKKIEAGDIVTLDYGASINGYCSDMTRTFFVDFASDKQKDIYITVLNAQIRALKLIKAGVRGLDVDACVREYFSELGFEQNFGHGLGHSVGLEIHENPCFNKKCVSFIPENAVMSVEPGLYFEGDFGVRIEDLVIVKNDGCEDITKSSKEIIIL